MSQFAAPDNLHIFNQFWLTIQMQRANQFFPSTGGWRNWKSLVFGQVVFLTSPKSFLSHKTTSYAGYATAINGTDFLRTKEMQEHTHM